MNFTDYTHRSIGLTQATAVLIASLLFGLISSAIYLVYNLSTQHQDAVTLIEEILTAAEGGATNAAWTLDSEAASQVVTSVMALHRVKSAILRDEYDSTLAYSNNIEEPPNRLFSWFTQIIVGKNVVGKRSLQVSVNGESRAVGTLSVELDLTHLADEFLKFAALVILTGLVQSFSIALLLLWLSSRLVTSPLRQVAEAIDAIDSEEPELIDPALAKRHKNNEFGNLIAHTNEMLQRQASTQSQLRKLATTDSLTNLPNRTLITDRLAKALAAAERNTQLVAVMFIDLDRFKNINDSLGHEVGDELLIETARRLSNTMRNNDSIGRLGGDEFLVVLEDIQTTDEVVHAVQRITASLLESFELCNHTVRTSSSIGISMYPNDGADVGTLMRCADLAMYEAKGNSTPWNFFADEMSQRVNFRMKIEGALSGALEREEFELRFQPKVHSGSQELAGCEALLRWQNAQDSISISEIIEIAEDTGMIVDIGAWVFEQACQQAKKWEKSFGGVAVSINVSAKQLQEPYFVEDTLKTIARCKVDPHLIELEITETILLDTLDRSIEIFGRLRNAGIKISIDDFGTGYSSLSYLARLPVDTLKIDRAFVSGPESSTAILEMIVAMAQTLQLKTVAEGVETEAQKNLLIAHNCDYLQGYLFSQPLSAVQFEHAYLRSKPVQKSTMATVLP